MSPRTTCTSPRLLCRYEVIPLAMSYCTRLYTIERDVSELWITFMSLWITPTSLRLVCRYEVILSPAGYCTSHGPNERVSLERSIDSMSP
jgi:hypothetical protein